MRAPLLAMLVAAAWAGCMAPAPPAAPHDGTNDGAHAALPTGPLVLFADGAEADAGLRSRTFMGPGLERPLAGAWHRTQADAHAGSWSWTFQDESVGRYHDLATYDLHVPTVDLTGMQRAALTFWYRGESEAASGDEFRWAAGDGRGTYEDLGSTDLPAPAWTLAEADLAAHVGRPVDIVFRFVADACGGDTPAAPLCGEGSFAGYFVDDVRVLAWPASAPRAT